ncbi:putative abhydrolase domain-containing protein [Abeliophyllum distichum]|uniref:Abhydrolase domain-containing protein n=1 Tax=Abeliophyllum distichum TaxID=126358 RepID=A0ABD1SAM1_9LAMI
MSSSSTGGDSIRCVGGEASPPVSPCMEDVLPIRGVDGSTGEAIPIDVTPSLRGANDSYRADVVTWAALDVPLIMVEEDLTKLREAYRIPANIELILPRPNERACFSRRGCTALHLNAFVSGMRLPLHPMLRRILRAYDLAPTQRVFDDPEPDLNVPSIYGIASSLPRCELSRDIVDVLRSIYQSGPEDPELRIDFEQTPLSAELDQERRPRPTLARLTKQRPKVLAPGSAEDTSQRKVIEDLSREGNNETVDTSKVIEVDDAVEGEVPLSQKRKVRASGAGASQAMASAVEIVYNYAMCSAPPLQRTLAVNTLGEVVLEGLSKSTQTSGGGNGGPYDSKRRFRELIEAPGERIFDDALWNLPFYPTMGAQAVKKYFTPKWEEFSSHGELEDVLEASLASVIRASTMQMKEHKQALEGLQAALDSARTAYEQMEADLKESDSSVLNLTKQLDNANAAQKVAAEALEAANKEKRRLLEEAKSRDEEISGLRKDLESSENGRKEAEAGKREVGAKLTYAEAEFVANFHNTEAYTNFSDYFAKIGQQEVLTILPGLVSRRF